MKRKLKASDIARRAGAAASIAAALFSFAFPTAAQEEFGTFKCCIVLNSGKTAANAPEDVASCFPMLDLPSCEKYKQASGHAIAWKEKPCVDMPDLCLGKAPAGCCKFGTTDTFICAPSPDSSECDIFSVGASHWYLSDKCTAVPECKDKIVEAKTYEPATPADAAGATPEAEVKLPDPVVPVLSVPIPGLAPFTEPGGSAREGYVIPYIAQYITAVYAWLLGAVSILAVAMIAWGGIKWSTAGGDSGKAGAAKTTIANAVIGVVLAFSSYLILWTLNPKLVQFQALQIGTVDRILIDPSMESQLGGVSIEAAQGVVSGETPGSGGVPLFKQAGGSWGNKVYGNCPTTGIDPRDIPYYGNAGCGPTSIAMVVKSYGTDTDPEKVGVWATKTGTRICGKGTGGSAFTNISGLYPNMAGEKTTPTEALKRLEEGKPIIFLTGDYQSLDACYKSSAHFMVATKTDGDWVLVNDPALCGMRGNKGTAGKIEVNGSKPYGITRMKKDLFLSGAGFWYLHPKT